MLKDVLHAILKQNQSDCTHTFHQITATNAAYRLTEQTASAGFIFRHAAETLNLLAQDFGNDSPSESSTIGQPDTGMPYDVETSRALLSQGYDTFLKIINDTREEAWLNEINTRWFGKISRIKLLSISLNHNSHHCGQAASAIAKGKPFHINLSTLSHENKRF